MRFALLLIAAPLLVTLATPQPAAAVLPFYNVFKDEYLKNHPDKKFVEEVDKAANKCFVCHQGKNRKHHNAFGIHLVEPLDKKEDIKKENREKVVEAIKKVVEMHVDPKDDKSETYLDRIKASKWPGGPLEELKKEPPEDAPK
jgi:hypothetical protein